MFCQVRDEITEPTRQLLLRNVKTFLAKPEGECVWQFGHQGLSWQDTWKGLRSMAVPSLDQLPGTAFDTDDPNDVFHALCVACAGPFFPATSIFVSNGDYDGEKHPLPSPGMHSFATVINLGSNMFTFMFSRDQQSVRVGVIVDVLPGQVVFIPNMTGHCNILGGAELPDEYCIVLQYPSDLPPEPIFRAASLPRLNWTPSPWILPGPFDATAPSTRRALAMSLAVHPDPSSGASSNTRRPAVLEEKGITPEAKQLYAWLQDNTVPVVAKACPFPSYADTQWHLCTDDISKPVFIGLKPSGDPTDPHVVDFLLVYDRFEDKRAANVFVESNVFGGLVLVVASTAIWTETDSGSKESEDVFA
jgi:hypothetical protein